MKELRILGSTIRKLSTEKRIGEAKLQEIFNCGSNQISAIFDGRIFPSFEELGAFADAAGTDIGELLKGDEAYYAQNVAHYMGEFEHPELREEILDIFEDYLTLLSATTD